MGHSIKKVIVKVIVKVIAVITVTTVASAISPMLKAQRRDFINQTLATALNSSTTFPWVSAPTQNIGQVFHQMTILGASAPSHTCTDPVVYAFLEGSYDNNIYIPIATVGLSSPTVNGGSKAYVQQGISNPWPYIRVVINTFDKTNCTLNVYYTGSIYPNSLFIAPSQGVINAFQSAFVDIAAVGAGTTTLSPASSANATVVLYNITITNNNTAADTITIGYGTSTNCTVMSANKITYIIPPSNTLIVQVNNTPLIYPGAQFYGQSMCIAYGALASRSINLAATIRFE